VILTLTPCDLDRSAYRYFLLIMNFFRLFVAHRKEEIDMSHSYFGWIVGSLMGEHVKTTCSGCFR
jgi:hypothetical protein